MADRTKSRAPAKRGTATRAKAKTKLSPRWRETFLAKLAETSNVSKSARAAHVSTTQAYKVRRESAEFRERWHQALCEGYDHLEMEVLRRLREGDLTTAEAGKFDFAVALRILSAHRDTVGAQKARQGDEDEEAVYASITAKIAAFRKQRGGYAPPPPPVQSPVPDRPDDA